MAPAGLIRKAQQAAGWKEGNEDVEKDSTGFLDVLGQAHKSFDPKDCFRCFVFLSRM